MGWDGLLLLNILHNNQIKGSWGIQVTMQWLLCQYIYSWGKTDTADTEDTEDTCLCVKLYCR